MHEEDDGILWKHHDLFTGRTEVRRKRRLVVSSIATVGNYEYGFYWYFYQDGTIELEVKLTGIMSTRAPDDGRRDPSSPTIAPGLAAPVTPAPVLRPARRDGRRPGQRGPRGRRRPPLPAGDNPWGNAFAPVVTPLTSERGARRLADPPQPVVARREPRRPQRPRPAGRLPAGPRPRPPCCPRGSSVAPAPGSPPATCGSRPTTPTSGGRRATSRTSTPAAPACRPGRPPTGRSSAPRSWCGTRSASPTSPGPRTGRSCRSRPPASSSCPPGSSTATRRSTSRPRTTADG